MKKRLSDMQLFLHCLQRLSAVAGQEIRTSTVLWMSASISPGAEKTDGVECTEVRLMRLASL